MVKKVKIAVIGGGRIGETVRKLLRNNGYAVAVWDEDVSRRHACNNLAEAIEGSQFVFLCVPSWGLRNALHALKPFSNRKQIFISFTKGIERGTKKFCDEIIHSEFPKNDFALIGGPFLAEELDRALYGVGVIGTKKKGTFLKIRTLFKDTSARFIHSSDVRGVAVGGVLKNIYAVGLGIADGLGWGANAKGWLAARLSGEMEILGEDLGAKEKTMHQSALADLIACGFSPHSRNRRTGEELLKWKVKTIISESVSSYPELTALVGKKMNRYPYFQELARVVMKKKDARVVFQNFLR